ncbi:MAG: hypothetical protein AAF546_11950 [Verrucomicrobiota bacterium]
MSLILPQAQKTDQRYASHLRYLQTTMNARAQKRIQVIQNRFSALDLRAKSAVAIRGSYARQCPTAYSDLDLVLLSDYRQGQQYDMLRKVAEKSAVVDVSVISYRSAHSFASDLNILALQDLRSLVYVCGDKQFLIDHKAECSAQLRTLNVSEFLESCALDKDDRILDHQSELSPADIKHGIGGLVEIQLALLVLRILLVRGLSTKRHYAMVRTKLLQFYWFNLVSLDAFRNLTRSPTDIREYSSLKGNQDKRLPTITLSEKPSTEIVQACKSLLIHVMKMMEGSR